MEGPFAEDPRSHPVNRSGGGRRTVSIARQLQGQGLVGYAGSSPARAPRRPWRGRCRQGTGRCRRARQTQLGSRPRRAGSGDGGAAGTVAARAAVSSRPNAKPVAFSGGKGRHDGQLQHDGERFTAPRRGVRDRGAAALERATASKKSSRRHPCRSGRGGAGGGSERSVHVGRRSRRSGWFGEREAAP